MYGGIYVRVEHSSARVGMMSLSWNLTYRGCRRVVVALVARRKKRGEARSFADTQRTDFPPASGGRVSMCILYRANFSDDLSRGWGGGVVLVGVMLSGQVRCPPSSPKPSHCCLYTRLARTLCEDVELILTLTRAMFRWLVCVWMYASMYCVFVDACARKLLWGMG